jgi:hypothetical protein
MRGFEGFCGNVHEKSFKMLGNTSTPPSRDKNQIFRFPLIFSTGIIRGGHKKNKQKVEKIFFKHTMRSFYGSDVKY